ncbi:hypothetical protein Tco_0248902 [Tanacetum coccineum]
MPCRGWDCMLLEHLWLALLQWQSMPSEDFDNGNSGFRINFSFSIIAIAMKLPVDLNTNLSINNEYLNGKGYSICFLLTMLANFLPSLGLMDDKELLVNMVAWAILLITITLSQFRL